MSAGGVISPHKPRRRDAATAMRVESFAPVARADARVLVLGSMPGLASLRAAAYYAHPRNRFWPFMGALVGAHPALPYPQRLARLNDAGIALWDVLRSCTRDGSLDAAIRSDGALANDFDAFFAGHPEIAAVLFNGARAQADFLRLRTSAIRDADLPCRRLPSTSPANAAQAVGVKFAAWRDGLRWAGIAIADDAGMHSR